MTIPTSTATLPGAILQNILDAASDVLDGVDDIDTSLRLCLSHGEPAWDGPLLAVHVQQIDAVNPLNQQDIGFQRASVVPAFTVVVTLLECAPTLQDDGTPPDPADLQASAESLLEHGWLIWHRLVREAITRGLFTGLIEGSDVTVGPLWPLGPEGGLAGWKFNLHIPLL